MKSHRPAQAVIGYFKNADALLEGMKKVRKVGFRSFDAFTPYPVHGLPEAQGLRRSPIPYVTFFFGALGCVLAYLFQYWTSAVDWPLNVGGKPFNSWPAFVPIMFELTVLFGGVMTFLSVIFFCGLPNTKKKTFDPAISRDRFAIVIEDTREQDLLEQKHGLFQGRVFDLEEAEKALKEAGAYEVRKVFEERWF